MPSGARQIIHMYNEMFEEEVKKTLKIIESLDTAAYVWARLTYIHENYTSINQLSMENTTFQ